MVDYENVRAELEVMKENKEKEGNLKGKGKDSNSKEG